MADLFAADPAHAPVLSCGTSKGWVPSEYMDEVCPPCRATPSDWLVMGDVLRLSAVEDFCISGRPLAAGDVVAFDQLIDYPTVRAVWQGPGDYTLLTSVAAGATCFCLRGDPETMGFGIDEFMRENGLNGAFEPGEEVEVQAYDWSTHQFVLREGRFVETEAAAHG